jgi:hypothetical protein
MVPERYKKIEEISMNLDEIKKNEDEKRQLVLKLLLFKNLTLN